MVVFICEWNHMQFSLGLLKQVADMCIYIISHICTYINTGWGKSMFTVVSLQKFIFILLLLYLHYNHKTTFVPPCTCIIYAITCDNSLYVVYTLCVNYNI